MRPFKRVNTLNAAEYRVLKRAVASRKMPPERLSRSSDIATAAILGVGIAVAPKPTNFIFLDACA